MSRSLIFPLLLLLILTACSTPTSTQTPRSAPTPTLIPPPVQGPAVLGDGVEIEAWEYLGPKVVELMPMPSANVRKVDFSHWEARLTRKEDGFELVWGEVVCATQPVVVVHADASIEFWPGEIVGSDCELMEVYHQLTVRWETDIPFEDWKFIFHPSPAPEA